MDRFELVNRMTVECISRRDQLSADIAILLKRIRDLHDEEALLRNDLRNNKTDEKRYTDEWNSLRTQKKNVSEVFDYLLDKQAVCTSFYGCFIS